MEVTGANELSVVFGSLLRVCENLICGLYSLKLRVGFNFSARISIRMIL